MAFPSPTGGLSRRMFLSALLIGGAGVIASCSSATSPSPTPPPATAAQSSAPPQPAPATPTSPPAKPTTAPPAATPVPTAAAAATSGTPAKIVWYNPSDPKRVAWEKSAITAFQKVAPSLEVDLQVVPWAQFDPKLSALWAAKTPPEVWSQWGASGFRDYYNRGMLLDQSDMMKQDAEILGLSDIPKPLQTIYTIDGKNYGIPVYQFGSNIFYNVELFEQAGVPEPPASWEDKSWNWEAMVSTAQKLTHDYGNPTKAQYGINWTLWPEPSTVWLWGGDIFDKSAYDTGVPTTNHLASPESVAAFQAVADLTYKQKVRPSPDLLKGFSAVSDPMLTGRIAMVAQGGFQVWSLAAAKFKWGIAPLPWAKTNHATTYSDPWFIAKTTPRRTEAWQLVRYLTGPEGNQSMLQALQSVPNHQSMLPQWYKLFPNIPEARFKEAYTGGLKDTTESANHILASYGQISDTLNQSLGPINLGQKTAQEQLPIAQDDLNRVLKGLQSAQAGG